VVTEPPPGAEPAAPVPQPALTVLYDGACPLCRREIDLYRGLDARTPVCFADVSDPAAPLPGVGLTRPQLLARFHVQKGDGTVLSGAAAFIALWAALPGWRWLARAAQLPGAAWMLERAYRLFLHLRPALQGLAARWERRAATSDHPPTRPPT
jgi:predicted DCC family thiol-disulfide oxidoreductase YuxK